MSRELRWRWTGESEILIAVLSRIVAVVSGTSATRTPPRRDVIGRLTVNVNRGEIINYYLILVTAMR